MAVVVFASQEDAEGAVCASVQTWGVVLLGNLEGEAKGFVGEVEFEEEINRCSMVPI